MSALYSECKQSVLQGILQQVSASGIAESMATISQNFTASMKKAVPTQHWGALMGLLPQGNQVPVCLSAEPPVTLLARTVKRRDAGADLVQQCRRLYLRHRKARVPDCPAVHLVQAPHD